MKPATNASTPISAPGGTLHRALRCQKLRKKRYGNRGRRGTITNQVSTDKSPAIVGSRKRFGDWETDSIIGAGQKHALVTMNLKYAVGIIVKNSCNPILACVCDK